MARCSVALAPMAQVLPPAALILPASLALAAPPPDSHRALSGWFESLTRPANGLPCCSISDCRVTQVRATPDGYDALIEGEWISIPRGSILSGADNSTGHAVVCYQRYHNDNDELLPPSIFCFVPPMDV
jgi:hypothetical protein